MARAANVPPEAPEQRLQAALSDLGLWPADVTEQRALTDSLLRYVALIAKWNRAYNLTAIRDPDRMLVQHVFDSAAIARPLQELVAARRRPNAAAERPRIVDVGSGAGLPGIVLALLWPDADFLLVEPVSKKAAFLQQVVSELALRNVRVARSRVEDLPHEPSAPDAIVCRAFASLADYVLRIAALAGPDTVVAAMKAQPSEEEKAALPQSWRVAGERPLTVPGLDARRSLVILERHSSGAGTA